MVNLSQRSFTNRNNERVSISVSGAGNHTDDIFQVGERFVYFCSEPNTQSNYTNSVSVEAE